MTLISFLYLTQLEEYEIPRIKKWVLNHPNTEVLQIKKKLIWTTKIRSLNIIAKILFFLSPEKSIIFGLYFLSPFDWLIKQIIVVLAFLKLKIFHHYLTIIAITGSWGKTTTKDTLCDLISFKYQTKATTGNHNTILGVCQDILKLPLNTQYFIAEIGAYYLGDISKVARIINPKFGIVTSVGSMHLERFGTIENILKTKMELPQIIGKNGKIFLPDNIQQKIFNIRLKSKNTIFFKNINQVYQDICGQLGINNETYNKIIKSHSGSDHRLQITKNGSITIIDDSYNSNPAGFKLALDTIKNIKSDKKILVTPGMIELGSLQDPENIRLAKLAGSICQHIIIVGQTNIKALSQGLKNTKSKVYFVNHLSEVEKILSTITTPNSVVLFENDLPDNYL